MIRGGTFCSEVTPIFRAYAWNNQLDEDIVIDANDATVIAISCYEKVKLQMYMDIDLYIF